MVKLTSVGQRLFRQRRAVPLGCPTAGDRAAAREDGRDCTVLLGQCKTKQKWLWGEMFGLVRNPVCQTVPRSELLG